MWNKPLKVYKGVTNSFDLSIQDFDQQPVPVRPYVFRFRAVDIHGVSVISKTLTFRPGTTNRLGLDITRDEITDLDIGEYNWAISVDDENGYERPLYLELNSSVDGQLIIEEWTFADDALASAVLTDWSLDSNTVPPDTTFITGVVSTDVLAESQLSPLHTVAIFKGAAVDGLISIEASNSPSPDTWVVVNDFLLTASTTNAYANFYGLYERVRFRFTPSIINVGIPGTLYYRLF